MHMEALLKMETSIHYDHMTIFIIFKKLQIA